MTGAPVREPAPSGPGRARDRVVRDGGDLRALLGIPFSDEQLAAITAPPEPLSVVAGAGSGKTAVMAARVVWLVGTGAVRAGAVLGLTFTNKAAAELRHRVGSALVAAGLLVEGDCADDGEPDVATYHSYAAALLGEHGLRLGIEPGSRLLTDAARFQLAARVICAAPGPLRALTKSVPMLVDDLLALESECSEHLVDLAGLRRFDAALIEQLMFAESAPAPSSALGKLLLAARRRGELVDLIEAYRTEKHHLDAIDFGDQMSVAARLAEGCPEVGEQERQRYRVVLLDEYQDTSVAQRRMLVGLFGGAHPVTAVGDPCQAIYGWRGASVDNLEEFGRHFPSQAPDGASVLAGRLTLTENRRNGERILALANDLAAPLRKVHRGVAPLICSSARRASGEVRTALLNTWDDEITWMGGQVEEVLREGTAPGEIAMLVRATRDIGPLHRELTRREIPVEVVGLGGLVHLPEVAELITTLAVLNSATANAALVRLLIGPRWRIGPRDLAMLGRRAGELSRPLRIDTVGANSDPFDLPDPVEQPSLLEALAEPGELPFSFVARQRFAAAHRELAGLARHVGDGLSDLLRRIIDVTGLDAEIAADPHGRATRRARSLAAFLEIAAEFSDLDGECSLSAFLAYLSAAEEHERGLDSAVPSSAESVKLMTAHKAKGLEWDVVFLPDLTAGVFPSTRGRSRWTTAGQCLPHPLRGDVDNLPRLDTITAGGLREFDRAVGEHAELEERRLAYVATTRPRHRLVGSGHWWGPTQKRPRGPSPYLLVLREHARAAGSDGGPWHCEPEPGTANPLLARIERIGWPAPLDPTALGLRRDAADLVAAARASGSTDDPAPRPNGPGEARSGHPTADDLIRSVDGLEPDGLERVAGWDRDLGLLLAEVRAGRSGASAVVLPDSLSTGQLLRLARDPGLLAREMARPMPRPPNASAVRGSRFHAWLAARFGQIALVEPEEVPGAADGLCCADAELTKLQDAFEAGEFADRIPLLVEAPFTLALAGRTVRGRIDAVYRDADGFEIVDWKTGEGSDADPLQLAVYRLAWAEIAGVPAHAVRAAFHHVRSGRTIHPPLPDRVVLEQLLIGPPASAIPGKAQPVGRHGSWGRDR